MARTARKISYNNIYHIILRGVNRRTIFESDADYIHFINTLYFYKTECKYDIFAYCLMDNHVHLLMRFNENGDDISLSMKKIEDKFIWWYNKKYERCGHLFQERFKSEPVESEEYLLTVFRYIHQNPLKAGITDDLEKYKWSSFACYKQNYSDIVDIDFIKGYFKNNQELITYLTQTNSDFCMDYISPRQSDEYAISLIKNITKLSAITELDHLPLEIRDKYIHKFFTLGISARQISRLTGISRPIVSKILASSNQKGQMM